MLPLLVGGGIALAGLFGKGRARRRANRDMEQLLKEDPQYAANPLAGQYMGFAKNLYNAPMPGAAEARRGILTSQAGTQANISRNATDASQALAMNAMAQGTTDNQLVQQGLNEADYRRSLLPTVGNAYSQMIGEGDKLFQDKVRQFMDKFNIRGQQAQNRANTWGDVFGLGTSLMGFGGFGGGNNRRRFRNDGGGDPAGMPG